MIEFATVLPARTARRIHQAPKNIEICLELSYYMAWPRINRYNILLLLYILLLFA